jgi:2'-hydroxyisoflavone reductase
LVEHEVGMFMEMPYWLPEELNGMLALNNAAALAAGLRFRPLEETARDVYAWDQQRQPDGKTGGALAGQAIGMKPEREAALLREWHQRHGSTATA